jgi:hypothetical protein
MDVQPLMQNREQALALWKKYQAHRHPDFSAVDAEIMRISKMVSEGKIMIAALDAIVKAGVNERGQPKLAIMRADQKLCYLDMMSDGRAFMHARKAGWNLHRAAASLKFEFPAGTFPTNPSGRTRRLESVVPHIPPDIRPKRGLQNYHVLYEAVWRREIPVDPMLLRRVGRDGDLWIVVGAWELTDIERAVLAGHMPKS